MKQFHLFIEFNDREHACICFAICCVGVVYYITGEILTATGMAGNQEENGQDEQEACKSQLFHDIP